MIKKDDKQINLFEQTKQLCKKYNIKPTRSRGQNFLITEDIYDDIIDAANLNKSDIVLEVGPGLGFLTERLAAKVKKVIAVELDDQLAKVLSIRLKEQGITNVEIINEDILKLDIEDLGFGNEKFKIVANLPYNITSIFLRKILSDKIKPKSITLMLQKEVAERIAAKPSKMSLLAVSVQFYSKPKIIQSVSRNDFWPAPEVESAIIQLEIKNEGLKMDVSPPTQGYGVVNPPTQSYGLSRRVKANVAIPPTQSYGVASEKDFFRLVKFGFSAKRKMLKNNLASGFQIDQKEVEKKLEQAGFNNKIRAQELSVDDWILLNDQFSISND